MALSLHLAAMANSNSARLIKRAAIIGRLFYHMAMVLMHQINPVEPRDSPENVKAQKHHAHQICGIVAHTKDRGVASTAIRSLTIASCVLKDPREQEEVMAILENINSATGWRLGKVREELYKAWAWVEVNGKMVPLEQLPPAPPAAQVPTPTPAAAGEASAPPPSSGAGPPPQRPPVHPLLVQADFSLPNHPYQNWYEPPNKASNFNAQNIWPG